MTPLPALRATLSHKGRGKGIGSKRAPTPAGCAERAYAASPRRARTRASSSAAVATRPSNTSTRAHACPRFAAPGDVRRYRRQWWVFPRSQRDPHGSILFPRPHALAGARGAQRREIDVRAHRDVLPLPLWERVARSTGKWMCVRIAMLSLSPCGRGWRAAPGEGNVASIRESHAFRPH